MKTISVLGYDYVTPDFFVELDKKEWGDSKKPEQGSIRVDLARNIILSAILVASIKTVLEQNVKNKTQGSTSIINSSDAIKLGGLIAKINDNASKAFELLSTVEELHKQSFTKSAEKKNCLTSIQLLLADCSHNYQAIIEIIGAHDKDHAGKFSKCLAEVVKLVETIDAKLLMQKVFQPGFMRDAYLMLCKKINAWSENKDISLSELYLTGESQPKFVLNNQQMQDIFSVINKGMDYLKNKTQETVVNTEPAEPIQEKIEAPVQPSMPRKFDHKKEGWGYGVSGSALFGVKLRSGTLSNDSKKEIKPDEKRTQHSNTVSIMQTGQSTSKDFELQKILSDLDDIINNTDEKKPVPSMKLTQ